MLDCLRKYDVKKETEMSIEKEKLKLYAITDRKWTERMPLVDQVRQAILGGATIVQLREKDLSTEEKYEEALQIRKICHENQVPLIINDDVELAIRCEADGVHVGQEDESPAQIRKRVPKEFIIGVTAKTLEQAMKAQEAGADYLGVGAVFPSPTKTNAIRITKDQLQKITDSVGIPVVAIGGITRENLGELKDCGAGGIAVVSELFGAEDIKGRAQELLWLVNDVLY